LAGSPASRSRRTTVDRSGRLLTVRRHPTCSTCYRSGPRLGIEAVLGVVRTASVVELLVCDVQALADDLGTFDKIFSCNVWLFWANPVAVFRMLHAHLAPGGTLAVTHLPRSSRATRDDSRKAAVAISDQLTRAGYVDIRREILELDPAPAACVLAGRQ
jgi:SAM-dependent methyltransferase